MTAKRVQRDIQALSENLTNCESMLTRALRQKGEKPIIQRRPRSATVTTKADRERPVTPIVTGPISRPTSPAKPPPPGKHLFHKEVCLAHQNHVNRVNPSPPIKVIMNARSNKDKKGRPKQTLSSTQLTSGTNNNPASKKIEAPKQTNINYEGHVETKVKTIREPPNTCDKSKHLTWAGRLKDQSRLRPTTVNNKEEQHVTSDATSYSTLSGSQSTFRNTSEVEDNIFYVNQSVQCGLSSSNVTGTTTSFLSSHSARKIGKDFSMINPIRLLNFLVRELDGKLESNRTLKDDTEARQLVREIEHILDRIPSDGEVSQNGKQKHPISFKDATLLPSSPPERDIDSQTSRSFSRSQKKGSAVQHVEAACKQLRSAQGCLQEEVKKSMLQITYSEKEGYLDTIKSLKSSLESSTKKADDYAKMITDLSVLSTELRKENEVIPMLRATEKKLYERIDEFKSENQILKAEIQNLKIKNDKLTSTLLWKDGELRSVKKEVTSLHQLVDEKMSGIKSIMPDFDKMFRNVDVDHNGYETDESTVTSNASELKRGGAGEGRDQHPVTSSPTSSANSSVVGDGNFLSWQRISNITNHRNSSCREVLFANELSALPSIDEGNKELLPISGGSHHQSPPKDTSPLFRTLRSTTLDHTNINNQNATNTTEDRYTTPATDVKTARRINHDKAIDARLAQLDKSNEKNLQQLQKKWNIKLPSPPRDFSGKEPSALGLSQLTDTSVDLEKCDIENYRFIKPSPGEHKKKTRSKRKKTLVPNSSDESIIELFAKVDAYFADVKMNNESEGKNDIGSSGVNYVVPDEANISLRVANLDTKTSSVKDRTTRQVHENVNTMIGVAKEKTTQQLRDEVDAIIADREKRINSFNTQNFRVSTKQGEKSKMKGEGNDIVNKNKVQHVGYGGDGSFYGGKRETEKRTKSKGQMEGTS